MWRSGRKIKRKFHPAGIQKWVFPIPDTKFVPLHSLGSIWDRFPQYLMMYITWNCDHLCEVRKVILPFITHWNWDGDEILSSWHVANFHIHLMSMYHGARTVRSWRCRYTRHSTYPKEVFMYKWSIRERSLNAMKSKFLRAVSAIESLVLISRLFCFH